MLCYKEIIKAKVILVNIDVMLYTGILVGNIKTNVLYSYIETIKTKVLYYYKETSKLCYIGTIRTNVLYRKRQSYAIENHQNKGAINKLRSCTI